MNLIRKIERAFQSVSPGKIGIREAQAQDIELDELRLAKAIKVARVQDIELDWRQIPESILARDSSIFSAFDAQGFRFILPAFMRWSLHSNYKDPDDVIQFLMFFLLPCEQYRQATLANAPHLDSTFMRKMTSPLALSQKWSLSREQITVLVEWLDECVRRKLFSCNEAELEQLELWRALAANT